MRNALRIWAIVTALAMAAAAQQSGGPTFADVAGRLQRGTNTELGIDAYWNQVRGQRVRWQGEVVDVRGKKNRAEIRIRIPNFPTYKGFNVRLVTYELAPASQLRVGDTVTFEGTLHKYKNKRAVVVTLTEGHLVP